MAGDERDNESCEHGKYHRRKSVTYMGSLAGACSDRGSKFRGCDASTGWSPPGETGAAGATMTGLTAGPKVGAKWSTGPVPGPGVDSHDSE